MAEYHVRPEAPQRVDGGKAPWDDGVVNEDTEYVFRLSYYLSSAVWKECRCSQRHVNASAFCICHPAK